MSREIALQHAGWAEPLGVAVNKLGDPSSNEFHVAFDGRTVEVEVDSSGEGSGWIRMGGRVVRFLGVRRGDAIQVWCEGRVFEFSLADSQSTPNRSKGVAQLSDLTAPMPGTILRIEVDKGDAFAAHQPLIIMESMKMEMTLSAPAAGVVKDVACAEGELVEMGSLLLRLAEAGDDGG